MNRIPGREGQYRPGRRIPGLKISLDKWPRTYYILGHKRAKPLDVAARAVKKLRAKGGENRMAAKKKAKKKR